VATAQSMAQQKGLAAARSSIRAPQLVAGPILVRSGIMR
jgi:hypothetical protein